MRDMYQTFVRCLRLVPAWMTFFMQGAMPGPVTSFVREEKDGSVKSTSCAHLALTAVHHISMI